MMVDYGVGKMTIVSLHFLWCFDLPQFLDTTHKLFIAVLIRIFSGLVNPCIHGWKIQETYLLWNSKCISFSCHFLYQNPSGLFGRQPFLNSTKKTIDESIEGSVVNLHLGIIGILHLNC